MLPNERINALFDATVQATEESIVNAAGGSRNNERHERGEGPRTSARKAAADIAQIQQAGGVG